MLRIAIIIGSTRPGRKAEAVAKWVYEIAQKRSDAEFELVDIKDFNLPLLDEPVSPTMGQYTQQHTKDWSAKIASFDAYVFVTPEYNHGDFGRAQERDRFSVRRVEQQGGWLRQLRRRRRSARSRAATSGDGGGANRHGPQPSLALHVYRLRELQRLQAGSPAREVCPCNVRPGDRLGRRVEDAAGEASIGRGGVN